MIVRLLKYFIAIPLACLLVFRVGERLLVFTADHIGFLDAKSMRILPAAKSRLPVLEAAPETLFYAVDLGSPAGGALAVSGDFEAGGGDVGLDTSQAGEIRISGLELRDAAGNAIAVAESGHAYRAVAPVSGRVHFRYRAGLGARGRHGQQGNFDARFASFDGRVFLPPLHAGGIRKVQVAFTGMDDRRAQLITPWRATTAEGVFRVEDYGNPAIVFRSLLKSPIVYGPFDVDRRLIGRTAAEVYSYAGWSAGFREQLRDDVFAIVDYFHSSFGFEIDGPLAIVWTPGTIDGRQVFGGVWVGGMAFEMSPLSAVDRRRNYELVAHRIAHTMNREPPYGVVPLEKDEHFWIEGWASYIELRALRGVAGHGDDDGRERLYQRYLELLGRNPEIDHVLADEPTVEQRGALAVEYLHYTKAPLAVLLLAEEISRHSHGSLTLEAFWSEVYRRYRGGGRALPLKQELQRFTGDDSAGFWCRVIASRDVMLPEWRGTGAGSPESRAASIERACGQVRGWSDSRSACEATLAGAIQRRPLLGAVLDELPVGLVELQLNAEKNAGLASCRARVLRGGTP